MGNLVKHAERELKILGEEPEMASMYLRVIRSFSSYGHSGGSAAVAIHVINRLLQYKNLTPLTNFQDEWVHHPPETWGGNDGKGIWQNRRNSEAFSEDGGDTYYFVNEKPSLWRRILRKKKMYKSKIWDEE